MSEFWHFSRIQEQSIYFAYLYLLYDYHCRFAESQQLHTIPLIDVERAIRDYAPIGQRYVFPLKTRPGKRSRLDM